MSIRPVGDRILVKPRNPQEETKSGLMLSKDRKEKQDSGTVVAVGKGADVQEFKPGDTVIYQKYGPQEVFIEKEKHVIVHIDEILGVEE